MVNSYDTFIFDLDGTLVTLEIDFSALKKELGELLASYGFPKEKILWKKSTIESLELFKKEMETLSLDSKTAMDKVRSRIYKYEVEMASRTMPIDGATNILEYLKKKGYKIAIVTRNNRRAAKISIKNACISQYIDVVVAREDVTNMKPDPEQFETALQALGSLPKNSVVVGDFIFEITAGKKLGCFTIGVLTGNGDKELLKGADNIISSVAELRMLF